MQVVRQRHDDEVDVRIRADALDRVVGAAVEAPRERLATLLPGTVVCDDPGAWHVPQPERVELADEA